jgi:TP901 family phage tail tape measure protein
VEIQKLFVTLALEAKEYVQGLRDAAGQAADTAKRIGASMQQAGKGLTAGVTLPLLAAGVAAVSFANDFNSGMANVASLGSEAQAAIADWEPMIQQVAIATGKSTADMTEGLYNVVSAFGVADDSVQVLEINARAAAAGLSTTTEAIALTSAVTKGYGDTTAEAVQYAADLALKTVQLGQTTFPELAASIGAVTPLTASLGVSQAELFAVMATGTGVTGNASAVATQLRGVLQSLMAPTTSMSRLMEELGYANGEAMLSSLGLQETIATMVRAAELSGEPLQNYIGSIEGQTLAMSLAGPQADTFTEKLAAMGDVAGTVDEAFAAQTEGVNAAGFQWEQLKVRLEVLAISIGQQLIPVFSQLLTTFEPLLDYVAQAVTWFAGLNPEMQATIFAVVGLVVAIGPLLVGLGVLISSAGTVIGAITAFSGAVTAAGVALGLATIPMWAIIAVIAVIIAVVYLVYLAWTNNWGGIQEKTAVVWAYILDVFTQLSAWVTGTLIPTLQMLYNVWVTEVWPAIQTALQNSWVVIKEIFEELGKWINRNIVPWINHLAKLWAEDWAKIQAGAQVAWAVIEPIFTAAQAWIKDKLPPILTAFGAKWDSIMSALAGPIETAKGVWDGFVNAVQGFWDWISNKVFKFDISLPDLPSWALPGSPLPIHTAWENFGHDMNRMVIEPEIVLPNMVDGASNVASPMANGGGGGNSYSANTTVNVAAGDDPLRALRASRLLDALGGV